ncbi:hypothetical protein F5Y17DRAFT_466983 [Xylariaceae sp. FL0594]|nr:hypothetical protein F5Y17DRAFT_466983 [Xylariaceae sp. FL0594]
MSTSKVKAQKTWLITGSSSGLGLNLAFAALRAGHRVLGTTRSVRVARERAPEYERRGGIWIELDPGRLDSESRFRDIEKVYGEVDVLVNNAGYAFIGAVEDTTEEEVVAQLNVNFLAPLRAARAVLPSMRRRRTGHVVLVSSAAGIIAREGRATYSASKFAAEAAHEALSREVAPFGIKVLIVQPGAFATGFMHTIRTPGRFEHAGGFSDGYKGTDLETMVRISRILLRGDPEKAADRILDAVENGHEYLRLMLGPDCLAAYDLKMGELARDFELTKDIAASTDLDEFKGR